MAQLPPADIVESLRSQFNDSPDLWSWKPLAGANPVFMVSSNDRNLIVKSASEPKTSMVVSRIFSHCDIPSMAVENLGKNWILCKCFNGFPLSKIPDPAHNLTPALFHALGKAAIHAELVGLRDRKINNLLINLNHGLPLAYNIDYETAFCAGIGNRIFRKWRYQKYLIGRLWSDILKLYNFPVESEFAISALDGLLRGMAEELERLNNFNPAVEAETWRQYLYLKTHCASAARLRRAQKIAVKWAINNLLELSPEWRRRYLEIVSPD
jgi:hypothetical protein